MSRYDSAPSGVGADVGCAFSPPLRFCGYQDARSIVNRADPQKANAQDGPLDCVEQTTDLPGWRPRFHGFHGMRLRAFLAGVHGRTMLENFPATSFQPGGLLKQAMGPR